MICLGLFCLFFDHRFELFTELIFGFALQKLDLATSTNNRHILVKNGRLAACILLVNLIVPGRPGMDR